MTKNRVKYILSLTIILFIIMLLVSGGAFAYFVWQSSTGEQTALNIKMEEDIAMTITPPAITKTGMRPTNNCIGESSMQGESTITIDNQTGVLARPDFKLKIKITDSSGNNITNETSPAGEKYRYYVKYAVIELRDSRSSISCDMLLSKAETTGRFDSNIETSTGSGWYDSTSLTLRDNNNHINVSNGAGTGVSFDSFAHSGLSRRYTVYVWVDSEYTATSVGENIAEDKLQDATITVSWSENSTVEQTYQDLAGEAYAVYSASDTSLRFYRSTTPITAGNTYNGRVATAVYTGFETETYGEDSPPPWDYYSTKITSVKTENVIRPLSTAFWFLSFSKCESFDLSRLHIYMVDTMAFMFAGAGYYAETFSLNLSSWDVSSVTDMEYMFADAGYNAETFSLTLNGWELNGTSNINNILDHSGANALNYNLSLVGWDPMRINLGSSPAGTIDRLLGTAGFGAKNWNVNLSDWDIYFSDWENLSGMFRGIGASATTWSLNLSNWDVSSVTNMNQMFYNAGNNAVTWNLYLDNWDTSNVQNMSEMFYAAGMDATSWKCEWISNFNTNRITNMESMFSGAGIGAGTETNLSSWDVSSVRDMDGMFSNAGQNATTWSLNLGGWYFNQESSFVGMFQGTGVIAKNWQLNIEDWNLSGYHDTGQMFYEAGFNATNWNLNMSGWTNAVIYNPISMFEHAGHNAKTWKLHINTRLSGSSYQMFAGAGQNATTWSLRGNFLETINFRFNNMTRMFYYAGYNARNFELDMPITSWYVSGVDAMDEMFAHMGENADYYLNLENWPTNSWVTHTNFDLGVENKILAPWDE